MYNSINTLWILVGAVLVFFMQAGFAMVETGLTRAKNAGNIMMKNLMDFAIGSIAFCLVGFGFMYGGDNPVIGKIGGIATESNYGNSMITTDVPFAAFLIFQIVFCGTAATIVSGAMAERTKFAAYCIYSLVISLVIYPISGHWIWGGGWLENMGFHDFAGSTAVHTVGGVSAFVGAAMLGPRIGKYSRDGKSSGIQGHSLTLATLGVFILWFGWFGFNGASTLELDGDIAKNVANILVNTNLSAAVSACVAMIISWIRYRKPDISMTLNGALAGLVAITAGCDTVSMGGAMLTGAISGLIVVMAIEVIDNVLRVDDPVGAVSVHGVCGFVGTILVGFLSDGSGTTYKGLLYGGGFHQLGIQLLGSVSVILYVAIIISIAFKVIQGTIGLRVSPEAEEEGLDVNEHNTPTIYTDILVSDGVSAPIGEIPKIGSHLDANAPDSPPTAISKVTIVTRKNKLNKLLSALDKAGVTGVTITDVVGCGIQKGAAKYYRGAEIDLKLLPKVQVDIVVSTVPVSKVVQVAENVLFTGNYGDGKIFVYDVRNVIKVRTGEEGVSALVDTEAEQDAQQKKNK